MQISQLPASSSFSGSDVLAIEIDGVTYKLTGATLATALKTLGNYVGKTGDTMTGQLQITRVSGAPSLCLSTNDSYKSEVIPTADSTSARLRFRTYSPGSNYFDDYLLPSTPSGKQSNAPYDILTTKMSVSSVSIGSTAYINSVSGGYVKLGRVVVFSVGYTMKAPVNQSVPNAITGLPNALNAGRFLVYDDQNVINFATPRFANISGASLSIKGPYTAGTTYYVSGAYISAS